MPSELPHHQRAIYEECRFCEASRRWAIDDNGAIVFACVRAVNREIEDVSECGGTHHFEVHEHRSDQFEEYLKRIIN